MNRRRFLGSVAALPLPELPLPACAEPPYGVVRQLSGEVYLNDYRVRRNSALRPGQTLTTGADGVIWFTVGQDAFFLRPESRLRLEAESARSAVLDLLRLVSGGLGATFSRGAPRRLVTPTATIGIRGTGVYLEAAPTWTYACTCFGNTEIASRDSVRTPILVRSENHIARRIDRDGRILDMDFIRHTSEETARLEKLVGRPNPFKP
jgi:hypothetical protein